MHAMRQPIRSFALLAAVVAGAVGATALPPSTQAFRQLTDTAMASMMQDMDAPTTGDVDRDFVAMMIPHHQGAIDMAIAELRYGRDERLKRIAQEIIVDQQQEIAAMRLALHEPLPPGAPAPTTVTTAKDSP
jgi:Uncharacterized protein conserved in bacteria